MTNEVRLLRALLRQHFVSFLRKVFQTVSPGQDYQHNWHIEVMTEHLERCFAGSMPRLIITLPPRYLKSICASVALPAWALGHNPTMRLICASYAAELAAKHARDCRAIMESAWYREVFPQTRLDPAKTAELEFATTEKGFRLTTSVGGTLTGRGGELIVIDDPLKASDALSDAKRQMANDWFRSTLYSRLDDKTRGRIVVITQRLHVDDLVGHLLGGGDEWVHLNLPAIAETEERFELGDGRVVTRRSGEALHTVRESVTALERIKRSMGSLDFSAQYQQRPVPIGGGLIKWNWFRTYDIQPERLETDFVTQSWDTACKADEINDYSACTTWLRRGQDHYLLHVERVHLDYPKLKQRIVDMATRFQADSVLIEDKGSGIQLIQDLQEDGHVRPIAIMPYADKITRMYTQTAKIEAGYVWLPANASWLDDFQTETLQFPNGRYDDQVDSLSQYLGWKDSLYMGDAVISFTASRVYQEWEEEFGPSLPH